MKYSSGAFIGGIVTVMVALLILISIGPTLSGMIVKQTSNNTGYVSNSSGCFYKMASGGDVQDTSGMVCAGFPLIPVFIGLGLFVAVLAIVVGYIKGIIHF